MRRASILITLILLLVTAGMVFGAPTVTIISPENGALIAGSEVAVSVSFAASAKQPVSSVRINLDGKSVTERVYGSPLARDECAFRWDTLRVEDGQHRLDAQIYSGKTYLGMATSVVTVANEAMEDQPSRPGVRDIKPPQVKIASPKEGDTVSGAVPVIIQAKDDSGKTPYISIFVDKSLKAITNREPFRYTWDSSQAENGSHEIHISALDDAENRTVTPPVRVVVRNAGGVSPIRVEPNAPSGVSAVGIPARVTEPARVDAPESESFEVTQDHAIKIDVSPLPPMPAHEADEPEVAVLVSGPTEFNLAAEPAQVAMAKIDEPKKPTPALPKVVAPRTTDYTVRSGDALWTIARRFDTTIDALVAENGLKDPSLIRIGQKLRIPSGNHSVMVPLRQAFDAAGGRLGWDAMKHAVHAWAPGTEVRVWIGSVRAEVNSAQVMMERPAGLQAGRTMVPQSFVLTLGMSK